MEVHQRCADVLSALINKLESTTSHTRILLVSHAPTTIALTRALLRNPNLPMRVGCCTLTILQRDPSMIHSDPLDGWNCKPQDLAFGSHLKNGIQRDWGFEDVEIANGDVGLLLSARVSFSYSFVGNQC
jgi:transcription factor C subunit 7